MSGFALFSGQTVDGDSAIYKVEDGGLKTIKLTGDLGGGTVSIMVDYNDSDYVLAEVASGITYVKKINVKTGMNVKLVLAGSTGANCSAFLL